MKNIRTSIIVLIMLSSLIFIKSIYAENIEDDEEFTVHIAAHNETMEGIAANYDVSISQILDWNDLNSKTLTQGQALKILEPGYYSRGERSNETLDEVLSKYGDYPVYIYVETLNQESRIGSLNGTSYVYGASVPKIVLAAFALDKVASGTLDWDHTFALSLIHI